jgi:hypothetical protein
MPHPLLTVSMIGAALLAAGSARAADMPLEPPAAYTAPPAVYMPPPVVVVPRPVVVVPPPAPCWRLGWGYPCIAGPPGAYWAGHRYGFGEPPYWEESHRWRRWHGSYW